MPGVLLWGWDDTNKVWRPIVVNSAGKLIIDPSEVTLDKLGDVHVPTPADADFVYWDQTAGLWKSRKLLDADIPAEIARDAEVDTKISDHTALKTGIHGVGTSYVAETSVEDLNLAAHAPRHEHGGADALNTDNLYLPWNNRKIATTVLSPVSTDGFTRVTPGTSIVRGSAWVFDIRTDAVLDQNPGMYSISGYNSPCISGKLFKLDFVLSYLALLTSHRAIAMMINHDAYPPTETNRHIGFIVQNSSIYASSADGTTQKTTDTGIDMAQYENRIFCEAVLNPGVDVTFYVDGVLKATHNTNVPPVGTKWFCFVIGIKTTAAQANIFQIGRVVANQDI